MRHRGIEYEGDYVTPDNARWEITERIALAGLMTHATVWRQGMEGWKAAKDVPELAAMFAPAPGGPPPVPQ